MARLIVSILFFTFLFTSAYALDPSQNLGFNIKSIEKFTGKKGSVDSVENIYLLAIPRDDLNIVVNGMQVTPEMGLTSKISFRQVNDQTILAGDLILSQDQVNPVMSVALNQGLEVTDLHNPFLWDSPRVMLMHIRGSGDVIKLAKSLNKVLTEMKATINGNGDFPLTNVGETATDLNIMTINTILNTKGTFNGSTYTVAFNRYAKANSEVINKEIAKNSWATFSGSDSEALLDGTVVVRTSELQSVLKSLRNAQIYVLAIYQHVINDDPNFVFVHYWGMGDVRSLARALRTTMVYAENHVEPPVAVAVNNAVSPYPFMQNLSCNTDKKWTKEIYANVFDISNNKLTADNAVVTQPSGFVELIRTGISSAMLKSEQKVNSYILNLAAGWIHHYVVEKNQIQKQNISTQVVIRNNIHPIPRAFPTKQANDFSNNEKLAHTVAAAMHVSEPTNLNSLVLYAQVKDYNYLAILEKSHPVIFDETKATSVSIAPKMAIQPIVNDFNNDEKIGHILAAVMHVPESTANRTPFSIQPNLKDYNYVAQLQRANPVIFIASNPAPQSVITIQVTQKSVGSTYDFNNKDNINHIVALAFHVHESAPTENTVTVQLDKKDYNYIAELQKAHPVIFDETKMMPISVIPATTESKKIMPMANDFNNDEIISHALAVAMHLSGPTADVKTLVASDKKDYNYIAQLQSSHPVIFDDVEQPIIAAKKSTAEVSGFTNNEKISRALAMAMHMPEPAADMNALAVQPGKKDYNYVAQLQSSHPVVFAEMKQPPVHANDFNNNEIISHAFVTAVHAAQPASEANTITIQANKKDYNYLAQLQAAHPVIFDESKMAAGPVVVTKTAIQATVGVAKVKAPIAIVAVEKPAIKTNDFTNNEKISHALAMAMHISEPAIDAKAVTIQSAKKDYNYVAQLQSSHPVVFAEVKQPTVHANDFNNSEIISHALATAVHIAQPASEANTITIQANKKDYNYIAQLQSSHPVVFVEVKQPTVHVNDFNNNEIISHAFVTAVHVTQPASETNTITIQANKKDYNYLAQLQAAHPVIFDESKMATGPVVVTKTAIQATVGVAKVKAPIAIVAVEKPAIQTNDFTNNEKISHALAMAMHMPEPAIDAKAVTIQSAKKDYNYVAQLQSSHPVVFAEVKQPTVHANDFNNNEIISHALATAVHIAQPTSEVNTINIQANKKDYNYVAQLQSSYPVIFAEIKQPAVHANDFNNNEIISHAFVTAVHVAQPTSEANTITIQANKKDYNYLAQLQTSHPVIFDESKMATGPVIVTKTAIQATVGVAKAKAPVTVLAVKKPAIQANDFNNRESISHALASAMHVAEPVSDARRLSNLNDQKDYNYLSQLQTSHPVVFDEIKAQSAPVVVSKQSVRAMPVMTKQVAPIPAVAAKKPAKLPIVASSAPQKSVQHTNDFNNNEKISHVLAAEMHVAEPETDMNNLAVQPSKKDYNYLASLQASHPIKFDETKLVTGPVVVARNAIHSTVGVAPKVALITKINKHSAEFINNEKISRAFASAVRVESSASNVIESTIPVDKKDYNYLAQLQKTHPIIFAESKENVALGHKLTTAVAIAESPHSIQAVNKQFVHAYQLAENKNFQIPKQIAEVTAKTKTDATPQSTLSAQPITKPLTIVTREDAVIPVAAPKPKQTALSKPRNKMMQTVASKTLPTQQAKAAHQSLDNKPIFAANDLSTDISATMHAGQSKKMTQSLHVSQAHSVANTSKNKPQLAKKHSHVDFNQYLETPHLPHPIASAKPVHKPMIVAHHEDLKPKRFIRHDEVTHVKLAQKKVAPVISHKTQSMHDDMMPFDGIAE